MKGERPGEMPKSVLIADDSEAVRWTVRKLLERSGFTVCGEASDGLDVLTKAAQLAPDLIILDMKMPKMNGIEAASILRRRLPTTPIVLLTLYEVGPSVASAAGVTAILEKPDDIKKLPECVRKLLEPPSAINTPVFVKS